MFNISTIDMNMTVLLTTSHSCTDSAGVSTYMALHVDTTATVMFYASYRLLNVANVVMQYLIYRLKESVSTH